jgi:predicted ATPase/DNA-binding winged helix-turn-helix (wHTH) protein
METVSDQDQSVAFDGWELRIAERQLLVHGMPVALGGRAFEVLRVLVLRRGKLVTKDELLDAAWPGMVVEENNISVQIAALRKQLGPQAIATVAGRGYQLAARPQQSPPPAPAAAPVSAPKTAPGEPTPVLLGREQDLLALLDCLADTTLATVTGPGGVGKTALARAAFDRCSTLLGRQGTWIDMAPVRDHQRVVPAVAQALGVDLQPGPDQMDALVAALGQGDGLVVLDNCEHVQSAVRDFVQRALASGCSLRWLVTSQSPLGVAAESVCRLDPLSVPPLGAWTPEQALSYSAVALLCQRVTEADRRFRLDAGNVQAVVNLCARLDGLPLAIEMVAPRVAALGIGEVDGLLNQRLKLSTALGRDVRYRHATLRDTYDWSYGLLSPTEQAVFRRLEPFLGGFVTDLAQQVARDDDEGGHITPWDVLEALASLVDKSLVQRGPQGSGRFHLLESARAHARACLNAAGEREQVQRRHACAVAQRLATVHDDADTMNDAAWIQRHACEVHNARAALGHCCANQLADDLARLVAALAMMDWMLCRQADVLQEAIPMVLLAQAAPRLKAHAYLELSWALFSDGDHRLGAQLAEESHGLFVALDEPARAYRALAQWTRLLETLPAMEDAAQMAWQQMRAQQFQPMPRRTRLFCAVSGGLLNRIDASAERLDALCREAEHEGFEAIAAIAACNRTNALLVAGRHADVITATNRAVARHMHAHRACACMLLNKTTALIRLGRSAEAQEPARRAFRLMPAVAPSLVDAFALAAARDGNLTDAAVLHGCGNQIRRLFSHEPDPAEADTIAQTATCLHAGLPAPEAQELMALGGAMAAHEALAIKVFSVASTPRGGYSEAPASPASFGGAMPAS